jgi:hypothetical protein
LLRPAERQTGVLPGRAQANGAFHGARRWHSPCTAGVAAIRSTKLMLLKFML